MFIPIKRDGLEGTKVGTSIFLTRERYSVSHVTRGGKGSHNPEKLYLSEGIDLVGGGSASMRTNP